MLRTKLDVDQEKKDGLLLSRVSVSGTQLQERQKKVDEIVARLLANMEMNKDVQQIKSRNKRPMNFDDQMNRQKRQELADGTALFRLLNRNVKNGITSREVNFDKL